MTPDLPAVELAIVQKTNDFRRANQLDGLRLNARLDKAARGFAWYLARTGKFSHTADGRSHSARIKSAGYKYCITAENLALNGDSRGFRAAQLAQDALTGWKKSPGHRKNLLRKYVTEIGIGVAKHRLSIATSLSSFLDALRRSSIVFALRTDHPLQCAIHLMVERVRYRCA